MRDIPRQLKDLDLGNTSIGKFSKEALHVPVWVSMFGFFLAYMQSFAITEAVTRISKPSTLVLSIVGNHPVC
jgi:hypothetical protein